MALGTVNVGQRKAGVAGGYATLDENGKLLASQLPSIDHYTQEEVDKLIAEAVKDMYTQTEVDNAIAEAIKDKYTQTEVDRLVEKAIADHDADENAHADIREMVNNLTVAIMSGKVTAPMLTQSGEAILTSDGEEIVAVTNL